VAEVSDRRELSDSMMGAILPCGCVGLCACDVLREVNPLERIKSRVLLAPPPPPDPPLGNNPQAIQGRAKVTPWLEQMNGASPDPVRVGPSTTPSTQPSTEGDVTSLSRSLYSYSSAPTTVLPVKPRHAETALIDIENLRDTGELEDVIRDPRFISESRASSLKDPKEPVELAGSAVQLGFVNPAPPPTLRTTVLLPGVVRPPGQVGVPPTFGGTTEPQAVQESFEEPEPVSAFAPLPEVQAPPWARKTSVDAIPLGPDSPTDGAGFPSRHGDSAPPCVPAVLSLNKPATASEADDQAMLTRVEDSEVMLQTLRQVLPQKLGKACSNPHWEVKGGVLGHSEMPLIRNCVLKSASLGLQTNCLDLWEHMALHISARQMRDWSENGGTRVMLEVLGVLNQAAFNLHRVTSEGDYAHTMKVGHRSATTTVQMVWDAEHVAVLGSSTRPPAPLLSLRGRRQTVGMHLPFVKALDNTAAPLGALEGTWQNYEATWERARTYASELKMGTVGTYHRMSGQIFSPNFIPELYDTAEVMAKVTRPVRCVQGFAGCGKSGPLIHVMAKFGKLGGSLWTFISPRSVNTGDTKAAVSKLLPPNTRLIGKAFNTFEIGMARTAEIVIVDEISLLPPGYLDLHMLVHSEAHYILLGDLTQNLHHAVEAESCLNTLEDEALYFAKKLKLPWLAYSHRIPQRLSRFFNIPSSNPEEGFVRRATLINPRYPVIVGSDLARADKNKNNSCVAYTSGTAQGMTTEVIQVVVDRPMLDVTMGYQTLAAMLTRATTGVVLVLAANLTWGVVESHYFFGALLCDGSYPFLEACRDRLALVEIMHDTPNFRRTCAERLSGQRAHADDRDIWLPYMRVAHPFVGPPVVEEELAPIEEVRADFHEPVIHLPVVERQALEGALITAIPDRLGREAVGLFGISYLYNDERWPGVIASAFPYHARNDEQLAVETIAKRLRSAPWSWNEWDFAKSARMGMTLWDVLCRALDLDQEPPAFDGDLFTLCANEQWGKRMENPAGLISQYEYRSDPEVDLGFVKHWVKTQAKTKMEAFLLEKFKAGAIISTCREQVIGLFGPAFRYCGEMMRRCQRNKALLVYGGMSPAKFSDWVADNWRPDAGGTCMVNDFSDFDSTQGGNSVWLEVLVMRYCQIPEDLVECYVHWKTHLRSNKVGPKRTSRDTGEPGTYLGNTWYSMAVTFARFGWRASRKGAWVFGGDDMATTHSHPTVNAWWPITKEVKTVSKLAYPTVADFCGWLLTPAGIMRSPTLMFLKMSHNDARGVPLGSYLASYAAELRFTYRLAGRCSEYLGTVDLAALSWCIRCVHVESSWLATLLFTKCADLSLAVSRKLAYFIGSKAPGRRANIRALNRVQARLERAFSDDQPLWFPLTVGFSGDRTLMTSVGNSVLARSSTIYNNNSSMSNVQRSDQQSDNGQSAETPRRLSGAQRRRRARDRAANQPGAGPDLGAVAQFGASPTIGPGGGDDANPLSHGSQRPSGEEEGLRGPPQGDADLVRALRSSGWVDHSSGFQIRVDSVPPGGGCDDHNSSGPGNGGSGGGVRSGPDRSPSLTGAAHGLGGHVDVGPGRSENGPGQVDGPGRSTGGRSGNIAENRVSGGSVVATGPELSDVGPASRYLYNVSHGRGHTGRQSGQNVRRGDRVHRDGGPVDPLVWLPETDARAADSAHRVVRDLVRLAETTDLLGLLLETRGHAPAGAPRASFSRATRSTMVAALASLGPDIQAITASYSSAAAGGSNRNPSDQVTLSHPATVQAAWDRISVTLRLITAIHARGDDGTPATVS